MVAEKKLTLIFWGRLDFHTLVMPLRALHASAFLTLMSLSVVLTHVPRYLKALASFSRSTLYCC